MKYKWGLFGFGQLMQAFTCGVVSQKKIKPKSIAISLYKNNRRVPLAQKYTFDFLKPQTVCEKSEILVLAVKPQDMADLIRSIKPFYQGQTVWTMAAGLEYSFYQKHFGSKIPLIRLMPNMPVQWGLGSVAYWASPKVNSQELKRLEDWLSPLGLIFKAHPEKSLHSWVALLGSGPAFVYYFIQSLSEAGESLGLPATQSYDLALQTVLGASHLLKTTKNSPLNEIARVASAKGTTQAGLNFLKEKNFSRMIQACLKAAQKRSIELGKISS